jgi:predicted nucleotidyltransferase
MVRYKKIKHNILPFFVELKKMLEADKDVIFCYLFGSYGRDNPNPLSDIDIAVYLTDNVDLFEKKMELVGAINTILKTDEVDLLILNNAPLSFQMEVISKGKLLLSKDEKLRLDFMAKTYSMYCDTEPLRKNAKKNMLLRIRGAKIGT